jgi:CRISPR-associated endonuclease Csy4
MKRKGETYEQASQAVPKIHAPKLVCPFVNIRSQSTGQTFSLFVDQCPASERVEGAFNSYGMSSEATVPAF